MSDVENPTSGSKSRRRVRTRRSRLRRLALPLLALGLVAVAGLLYAWLLGSGAEGKPAARALATEPAAVAERTLAMRPLSLPHDDAPHAGATEWWYYTGHLTGADGSRHAFHATVFLRDGMVRHTVFHGSLSDETRNRRRMLQLRTAGIPTDPKAEGFDFRYGDWRVAGAGPRHSLRMAGEGFVLELAMQDSQAPLLHRAKGSRTPGLVDFGEAGISYYYSRPRMAARGTLATDGAAPVVVSGEVWFDHQWGNFDASRQAWNWFALQLDDGSDLMIYQAFDAAGKPSALLGSLRKGEAVTPLDAADLKLTTLGVWRSAASGVRYPAGWDVDTPFGRIAVRPVRQDSEFNGLETTFKQYWEGGVRVSGARGGQGFLEMSGYDLIPAVQPKE
ncbi:lipocalin family protein [Thauera sp. 2A1]|uniref:lipocalin family protein n=1 Tax=Thauera sp. 2A1 TaxID=2570191 RepID=UPI0012910292|nr:lipocalin family protein [Thauera sp. 2A1]KAI5912979.1 hypothetical protein GH664_19690 [Thauera sp. 2A1]